MSVSATAAHHRRVWLWCGLLIAVFVTVRAVDLGRTDDVRLVPDSRAFLEAAAAPLGSAALWAGPRAPFAPLVYRLAGGETQRIATLQGLLAMAAWVGLSVVAARAMRTPRGRVSAVLVVLSVGACPWVMAWDHVVMAESLTLSLLALWIAAGIEAVWRPRSVWPLMVFAGVGAALAVVRDGSSIVVGPVGLVGLRTWRTAIPIAVARTVAGLVLVMAVAGSTVSAAGGGRWLFPYLNVIAQRVLPDADRTDWFASHGMPLSPALTERAGGWAHSDGAAFYRDPRLEGFRRWVVDDGRSTLASYLVTHPVWTIAAPLADVPDALWPDTSGYVPEGWTAPLEPPRPSRPLREVLAVATLVLGCGLAIRVAVAPRLRRAPVAVVAAAAIVLALPQLVAVWHADALQAVRHLVPTAVQLQLGIVLLLAVEVDRTGVGDAVSGKSP